MISWAALMQRKESRAHLLNAEGEAKPYSQEELMHKQLIEGQHFSDWLKDMRKQRKEPKDAYWGASTDTTTARGLRVHPDSNVPFVCWICRYFRRKNPALDQLLQTLQGLRCRHTATA